MLGTRSIVAVLVWVGTAGAALAEPAHIALTPCRLKGVAGAAECGVLEVPEDRAHPERRTIRLKVAVLRALARKPAPDPLFLLAGGPGQSALEAIGPLTGALHAVRQTRDFVLVDQRGTGSSNPLKCALLPPDAPIADRFRDDLLSEKTLGACMKKWSADLTQYTTPIAMQDLDDVRNALGYERINLWGGSYGTRAALVYLREHGAHVRTVILDGVAPLQQVLPTSLARDAQRAIELLFDSCERDPACKRAFPDLRLRFTALLAELDRAPAHVTVANPLTGEPSALTISRQGFVQALRGQLYQPDLAVVMPLTIDRASRGDWAPFVAQNAGLEASLDVGMYLGLLFATTCAEDMPYTSAEEMKEVARGSFLGSEFALVWPRVCALYPKAVPMAGFRDPVRSDKPVLLLSGELDPATPPSWAEAAKQTLPGSAHVVMPGVGHGITHRGCTPKLVAKFLEAGTVRGLDLGCAQQMTRPPFFVSFAGPTP